MLANNPPASKHPNIEEFDHDLPDFKVEGMDLFATRADPSGVFNLFQKALPEIAKKLYKVPVVKELYDRRKEFDVVVIDHMFNEVSLTRFLCAFLFTVGISGVPIMLWDICTDGIYWNATHCHLLKDFWYWWLRDEARFS